MASGRTRRPAHKTARKGTTQMTATTSATHTHEEIFDAMCSATRTMFETAAPDERFAEGHSEDWKAAAAHWLYVDGEFEPVTTEQAREIVFDWLDSVDDRLRDRAADGDERVTGTTTDEMRRIAAAVI